MVDQRISIPKQQLEALCEKWSITELAFFGSVLRDDFGPESDLDVLVSFSGAAGVTFSDLDAMESELTELFGRKVDLISRRGVEQSENYLRRREILDHAEAVYRAA